MLDELRIRGLGVIEAATVPLHRGFTVVTGETGAGKTMVVHSLGLLLGARADTGLVRTGAGRAVVEGRLSQLGAELVERAVEAGAELDEGDLLVGRSVGSGDHGRSRAWMGGAGVPAATLAEVTGAAIVVHGQHDQLRLTRPAEQRSALDRFAGDDFTRLLRVYEELHDEWRAARSEADRLLAESEARREEAEELTVELAKFAAVAPQPDEDVLLRARADRLRNSEDLLLAAQGARDLLAGEDGQDVATLAGTARRLLDAAAGHDRELAELGLRAAEVAMLAADLAGDLSAYAAGIEADPSELARVEERRAELTGLCKRHGGDVATTLAWAEEAQQRLLELESSDDRSGELTQRVAVLDSSLDKKAAKLSKLRKAAAGGLAGAVDAELAGLAMAQAHLTVEVRPGPRGRHGSDDVEFLLVPHPGSPARPLGRGASGGELSRVMLAVEVVLAGADEPTTMVFDEVDAGVGGRAAVEIGRRLAQLARTHQVVCVTHLPQVAAFADAHLRVVRSDDGRVTQTGVEDLDDSARVRELSRMLGGLEASDLAQGHARELLDLAGTAKAASVL